MISNPRPKARRKRLRKKLRLAEFTEYGFQANALFHEGVAKTADLDQLFYDFTDFVGTLTNPKVCCGGGGDDNQLGLFISGWHPHTSATEEQRQVVKTWLEARPEVQEVLVSELVDAWHGPDDPTYSGYYMAESRRRKLPAVFANWVKKWREETMFMSSVHDMIANRWMQQRIIKQGEPVIPFILVELQQEPDDLYLALHEITGEDPIAEEDAGKFDKAIEVWLEWGREKGYIKK